MQPRSVDFPAPFGPMRHVSEPAAISSDTPSTALTAPNAFVTPESSQAGSLVVSAGSGEAAAATSSGSSDSGRGLVTREAAAEVADRRFHHVEERGAVLLGEALEHRVLELGDRLLAGGEHAHDPLP